MCGIVGYIGPRNATPIILNGLKRLEYRGYDSAGIAVVNEGGLQVVRCAGKLRDLEESLRLTPLEGTFGIGHTRWATHGRPTEENAHPHRDCTGRLVVVHNGIIENYIELKRALQTRGRGVLHRDVDCARRAAGQRSDPRGGHLAAHQGATRSVWRSTETRDEESRTQAEVCVG